MIWRFVKKRWPAALPFVLFLAHAWLFRAWLVDDAGITFAYARNLAHGYGLVSQPGVERVEGFSNPLWTLLVSPLMAFDPADPAPAVKLLSAVLVLGAFAALGGVFRALFGAGAMSAVATASALACLALNTSFVVWTTSGLENPLYAALIAAYALLQVRYAVSVPWAAPAPGDGSRRSEALGVAPRPPGGGR